MKTNELREKYLTFFEQKGHRRCASDVLVPTWDPSVLFTPAGMNQFKDHFLGKVKLEFTRATSCQKCLRTGDIDNVGRTPYHHTFFEMLGNFSFGDYFKRDAIHWAWEFVTDKKWLGIDPGRLTVSVYLDDDEAANIWADEIGLSADRIARMGEHDNFWPAGAPTDGPDGVCGPCSEIFFWPDQGKEVEIWNLVFTQFNRQGAPPNNLSPLPKKSIDTGMGLERAAAALQGVPTNFHIDILKPIVDAAAEVCGQKYELHSDHGRRLRRITDHVRACTMAVHENVYPGSQKEKYVIRRLLRRAVLDGHQMGMHEAFLYKLVPAVVEQMKVPYPELTQTVERVADVIKNEETNFFDTIDAGLARMERIFESLSAAGEAKVRGDQAAELYQTYGVPPELFEGIAADRKFAFDWEGFRQAMERHGEASGKAVHTVMGVKGPVDQVKQELGKCEFLGYDQTTATAELKFVIADNRLVPKWSQAGADHPAMIVLDRTPFYGESGGQVGDTGTIEGPQGCFLFRVTDTQRDSELILHRGYLERGEVTLGQTVTAAVDADRRQAIRRAHSATHILHYALQKNLGSHAQQQGSKVDDDWLRFDFTNMAPVSEDQLVSIQRDVDQRIVESSEIHWRTLPLPEARSAGAMMLFGEKYPDPVRMVSMGNFSKELCGGTHLHNTHDVERFEILSEEGVAAGTRRIVAITGHKAQQHADQIIDQLKTAADVLKVAPRDVPQAIDTQLAANRDLKKQLSSGHVTPPPAPQVGRVPEAAVGMTYQDTKQTLRRAARALNVPLLAVADRVKALMQEQARMLSDLGKLASSELVSAESLLSKAESYGDAMVVVSEVPAGNPNLLRQLVDGIRKKSTSSAVFLAAEQGNDKVILVAGVSRDLVSRGISAGDWVRDVAPIVGGGGGGKPDMAQAGGKQPEKLHEALDRALAIIRQQLSA